MTAAELLAGGIAPALEYRAVITMNARILGAIRHRVTAAGDTLLAPVLADEHITIEATVDRGRFLAALLVTELELAAVEKHLLAIREDSVDLGYTSARVKYGFNRYAVDAAVESIQIARDEIKEERQS